MLINLLSRRRRLKAAIGEEAGITHSSQDGGCVVSFMVWTTFMFLSAFRHDFEVGLPDADVL